MRRPPTWLAVVLVASLAALVTSACGGQGRPDVKKRYVAVGGVLKQGTKLGTASVRAGAYPVGDKELVLAGKKNSVFALGPPSVVRKVRNPGARVIATGPVRRLTAQQAKQLDAAVKAARSSPTEVKRALRTAGSVYVAVERIGPDKLAAKQARQQR
jgi:hypothetical protein